MRPAVCLRSALLLLLLSCAGPSAADTTVSDGTLSDADWSVTKIADTTANPGLTAVTGAQVGSGGNPDAYRRVDHNWTGPGGVTFVHLKAGAVIDPAAVGGITSIDYAIDVNLFDGGSSGTVAYGLVLFQNGNYNLSIPQALPVNPFTWSHVAFTGLTNPSFSGPGLDLSAAGAPIQVGYYTSNGTGFTETAHTASGLDNFSVTFHTPPPAGPDLVSSIADPRLTPNRKNTKARITAILTVLNQGTLTAGASRLRVFLSDDDALDSGDVEIKSVKVPALRAGRSRVIRLNDNLRFDAGLPSKKLIVVVDADKKVGETDETNNETTAGFL